MHMSLHAARSALLAASDNQSVIANNLANATTTGFKKVRQEHSDFIVPGVQVAATKVDFSVGSVRPTEKLLDVSIQGDGFFQVDLGGITAYTRAGSFTVDADGNLVNNQGARITPALTVPEGAQPAILPDGRVVAKQNDEAGTIVEVGQLEVARFPNNQGLVHLGDGLFAQGPNSGDPILGEFGEEGFPALLPSSLEDSNVELADEFTQEIVNQRWFQANSRTFQTTDRMIGETIDLLR